MQLQTIETRSNPLNRQTYIFSPLFFQVSLVGNFENNICLWRFHRWWYDVVSHLFRIWSTIRYIGEVRSENWGNGSGISSTLDTTTILYRSPTCLGHNFSQARYLAPWDHQHWHILSDTYDAIFLANFVSTFDKCRCFIHEFAGVYCGLRTWRIGWDTADNNALTLSSEFASLIYFLMLSIAALLLSTVPVSINLFHFLFIL